MVSVTGVVALEGRRGAPPTRGWIEGRFLCFQPPPESGSRQDHRWRVGDGGFSSRSWATSWAAASRSPS